MLGLNINDYEKEISELLTKMKNFDLTNVRDSAFLKIQKYIEMPEFNEERMLGASLAGAKFTTWTLEIYKAYQIKKEVNLCFFLLRGDN